MALRKLGGWMAALVGSSLALGCAPPGPESEEERDDARQDYIIGGSVASAYPEAALVDMMSGGYVSSICSGAVIAPRVVLTAGHCVVGGYSAWRVRAPHSKTPSKQLTSKTAATFDYTSTSGYVDPYRHDVGLVFLSEPIELASYPVVSKTKAPAGSKLRNIGRIDNGYASYSSLFIGPAISFTDGASYGYPYSYVSTTKIQPGDSGGLVVGDGTHTIFAVNSGAGGGTQILARVDLVYAWIDQQVKAHGGWATPSPSPDPGPAPPGPGEPAPPDPDPADPEPGPTPASVPTGQPGCAYGWKEFCDGDMYVYCKGGQLYGIACGSCEELVPDKDAVCYQ